jgi:flagellar biosynthesis protein FliP
MDIPSEIATVLAVEGPAGWVTAVQTQTSDAGTPVTTRIVQLIGAITILSIAPGLLMTVTCFPRFIIAFSFLRTGLGLQTTPANAMLASLALFMTAFVMSPVFEEAWVKGVKPLSEQKLSEVEAFNEAKKPFMAFMKANVREKDLQLFAGMLKDGKANLLERSDDWRVLVPAFMISEIRRGFEIGVLIVLPFLVIDLVVATLTMAMGMMMMPPTVISLPFKVLFFILMDGWNLIVGSLVRSVS